MESYDDDWEPPSEPMMKLIAARRERSDKISKRMGDYLLKGYKMLGTTCPQCDTILMETRQGVRYCIACSELDSDADKDDPVTSQTAALAQAREQEVREDEEPSRPVTAAAQPPVPVTPAMQTPPESLVSSMCSAVTQSSVAPREVTSGLQSLPGLSCMMEINQTANASSSTMGQGEKYVRDLLDKMDWASAELRRTPSVDYSIQLCHLIKSCAEALSSVKAALSSHN